MIRITLLGIAFLAAGMAQALAQTPSDLVDQRYTFTRVEEGFLRLDTRTGEVSLCMRRTPGWACQTVADERAALENEIARLQSDNVALKKELLARGVPLPTLRRDMPNPPEAKRKEPEVKLPSQAELDQMRDFIGKVWKRFVEMIANLQKDMMQKT